MRRAGYRKSFFTTETEVTEVFSLCTLYYYPIDSARAAKIFFDGSRAFVLSRVLLPRRLFAGGEGAEGG